MTTLLLEGGVSGEDGTAGDPKVTTTPYTYTSRFGDDLLLDYWTFIEFPNPAAGMLTIHIKETCTTQIAIDSDGDGIPDFQDIDDDNDGITDLAEFCNPNANFDCLPNAFDPSGDEDGDNIPNYLDVNDSTVDNSCEDLNDDGICDQINRVYDTDGDQVPDHLDLDSDNDGITDLWEAGHEQSDVDNNGIIDGAATDFGLNGLYNPIATDADDLQATMNYFISDSDKDRIPDHDDLDADNDGLNDVLEGNFGALDTNNDGRVDDGAGNIPLVTARGLPLAIISDTAAISVLSPPDTDGDSVYDLRDLDSDNDGINDVIENIGTDADEDGIIGMGLPKVDENGVALDTTNVTLTTSFSMDTDTDLLADFRDLDSDADGIFDVIEAGQPDADNNGVFGTGIPLINRHGQGIEDATGTSLLTSSTPTDTDNDNQPDFQDIDRDGDGIPDKSECPGGWPCIDTDGDLLLDLDDLDSDGDLLLDADECPEGIPCLDADTNEVADFLQYNCHVANTPLLNTMTTVASACQNASVLLVVSRLDSLTDTLTYNWTGPNDFSLTGQSVTIDSFNLAHLDSSGVYNLVLTTPQGCESEQLSTNVVLADTLIAPILQLNRTTACEGEDIELMATTIPADSMNYNWYFTYGDGDTTVLIGITTDSVFQLTNITAASAGAYSVAIEAEGCGMVKSESVDLAVTPSMDEVEVFAFAFTEDPVCSGSTISLNVFEIEEATYEWYGPQGLVSTAAILDIDTSQITMSGLYYANATIGSCTFKSNEIEVTIKRAPEKIPVVVLSTESFCAGDELTLSTASVEGDSVQYQWYVDNGEDMELVATTTDTLLQLDSITNSQSGNYSVMVDIEGCTSEMSEAKVVEIYPSLVGIDLLGTFDTTKVVCTGTGSGASLQLPMASLDSNAVFSWFGPNGLLSNEPTLNLEPAPPELSGNFYATVAQGNCTSTTNEVALQIANSPTTPTLVTLTKSNFCIGETIELNIADTDTEGLTYQWFYNSPDTTKLAELLTTTTTNNFTIDKAIANNTGSYSVAAMSGTCASVVSEPMPVFVQASIASIPIRSSLTSGEACEGTDVGLSVGEIAGATYEWFGPNGSFATQLAPNLSAVTPENSGDYYVEVTLGGCINKSEEVALLIHPTPTAPQVVASKSEYCYGESIQLSVKDAVGATTQYEWYVLRNNDLKLLESTPIPNFTIENARENHTGEYALIATSNGCASERTAFTSLTVQPSLSAISSATALSSDPVCSGESINFFVSNVEGAKYEWFGPDGSFSQQQNPEIAVAMPAMSGRYFAVVTAGDCSESTEPVDVLINGIPGVPQLSVAQNDFCSGETIQLNATITNGNEITYQWYFDDGFEKELLASTEEPTYFIDRAAIPNNGQYSVEVEVDGCISSVSNVQKISIQEALGNLKASSNATLTSPACAGERVILTATNIDDAEYEWYGPTGIVSRTKGFTIPNATLESAGKYYAQVTVGGCTKLTNEVDVVVQKQPDVPLLRAASNELCFGSRLELATSAYSGNTVRYNWYYNDGNGEDILVTTTPSPNFAYSDINEGIAGTYSVEVIVDGCTSAKSNAQLIQIQSSLDNITAFSTAVINKPVCEGETVSFFTTPVDDATYKWYGPNGFFSDQPNPSILSSQVSQTGEYYAVVSFDGCGTITNEISLRVLPKPEKPEIFVESNLCTGSVLQLSATSYEAENISYNWTFNDGKTENRIAATDIATFPISNLSPENSGFYSVNVEVDGCTSSASDVEKVEIQAPLANRKLTSSATTDNPACTGERVELTAPFVTGATYEWFGPDGFSSRVVNPSINSVAMENTGEYFAVVTVNGCPTQTDKVEVVVKPTPETPFLTTQAMELCVGENAIFAANNPPVLGTNRDLFYQWFKESTSNLVGETQQGLLIIPSVTRAKSGNYFVSLMNEGCASEPSNMVEIEVDEVPEESALILEDAGSFCAESEVVVEAVQPAIGIGQWSVPNSTVSIIDAANPSTLIRDLDQGSNTLIWSLSYKGCENFSTDTLVLFRDGTSVRAEDDEYTIDINTSLIAASVVANDQLSGLNDFEIKVMKEPAFGRLINDNGLIQYEPNPNFYGYDEFEYEVCNTNCSDMCDQAVVKINIVDKEQEDQCFIPNIITPNGDGLNDALRVPCIDQVNLKSDIKIFNRWGDVVYNNANYKNDWTGTYDGKQLPPGTYFYLLRVGEDQTKCQQGYFQLVR